MQPYFSIILPIYNVEDYLKRCIDSILVQDYTDYEIILVDDGSSDMCPEICDQFASLHDDQIRVVHKTNGGLSSARNRGFQEARGKYIWWVDSDDWIAPGALRKLHEASVENHPNIVKFNYYRVETSTEKVISNAPTGYFNTASFLKEQTKLAFISGGGKYGLSAWSHIYNNEYLQQTGIEFISERIVGSEDYLFNLSLFPQICSMMVLPDALYYYEKRDGSLSQKYRNNLSEQYTELFRQLLQINRKDSLKNGIESLISSFYVWHLIKGTCMQYEYSYLSSEHTLNDARKKVHSFFCIPEFQRAVKMVKQQELNWKMRIQLYAMRYRIEPFFYWLYIVKPRCSK